MTGRGRTHATSPDCDQMSSPRMCSAHTGRCKATCSHVKTPNLPEVRRTGRERARFESKERGRATSAERATSPVKKTDHTSKRNNATCSPLNKVLTDTLDKLKIKKQLRSEATAVVNKIVENIIKHMRTTECFYNVKKRSTGSQYENVKISQPDEFDVMLTIPVQSVIVQPFDIEGAFYSAALKGYPRRHPLNTFVQEDGKSISATVMLAQFRTHVIKAVKHMADVKVERKKRGCPAVTLQIEENDLLIGLDVVLGLEVHSCWPPHTQDGFRVEEWLGAKTRRDFTFEPFFLVPKYEGAGNEQMDGVCAKDAWRISFSHVEKSILKNHSYSKTCCTTGGTQCCRKQCLKLLKYLLVQLKEKHPKELSKFSSYQAKTALFHACSVRCIPAFSVGFCWSWDGTRTGFRGVLG
ncbi:hypothetical protein MATL_G00018740 [Megalops atlanticus]|uniref:Cyclic GMP-AMP synthase n=1 Tax=Megalops atlanticus TaxID=7932 RepID=A0A9D3QKP3_MEGAT|nr:hypothetical protein MATL_G00018740 [Megalops atlanticus]